MSINKLGSEKSDLCLKCQILSMKLMSCIFVLCLLGIAFPFSLDRRRHSIVIIRMQCSWNEKPF